MRYGRLILLVACGLVLTACGSLLTIAEDGCRITDIAVSAQRDEKGNQVNIYDFRFIDSSACEGAHARGSYNVGTHETQERVRRPGATASTIFDCPTDPWVTKGVVCTRIELLYNGNVTPSQADLAAYERAAVPLSAYPLIQIDRDTLKGQLGNALKRLPPVSSGEPMDSPVIIGTNRPRGSDVLAPAPTATLAPSKPQPPSTGEAVRRGAQGRNVEAIQFLLLEHDVDVVVDGNFGPQMEAAVRAFQRSKGLVDDGIVGPNTWSRLWVTVRQNAPNADAVQAVQSLLSWHGLDVVVDGDFGDQTVGAVRTFQQLKQLTVDGVVGTRTWTALVNAP